MRDCEFICDGMWYGIGRHWITAYRGSRKIGRLPKTYEKKLDEVSSGSYGKEKTKAIVNFILERGGLV